MSLPRVHRPVQVWDANPPSFCDFVSGRGREELSIGSPPGSKEALGEVFIDEARESEADDRD